MSDLKVFYADHCKYDRYDDATDELSLIVVTFTEDQALMMALDEYTNTIDKNWKITEIDNTKISLHNVVDFE